jgi:exonuclease III
MQELPELWLVNVYVPNSGEGLKRLDYRTQQWDKAFAGYVKVWHAAGSHV